MLTQAGAIPIRKIDGRWEYLLVTSKRGNWIFPKGIVEPGESREETAAKECREEAGIRGRLLPRSVGHYRTRKWKRECDVHLFILQYEEDIDPWEEGHMRDRRWCTYQEAVDHLKKDSLRDLLDLAQDRIRQRAISRERLDPRR